MKRNLIAFGGALLTWLGHAQAQTPTPSAAATYRFHCTQVVTEQWMKLFDVTNAFGPASMKISFEVSPEGLPTRIVVLTATNGAITLRRTVLHAARASRFDPMPAEAVQELGNQPLKVNMEFALQTQ